MPGGVMAWESIMKKLLALIYFALIVAANLLPLSLKQAYADPVNLIANPSAEISNTTGGPANWTSDKWGTNATTFSYMNTGHTGAKSLYINMTSRTNGDAKWMSDPVSVTPNTTYTYSEYYESNTTTELDAQYTDASGNVSYAYIKSLPAAAGWTQASANLTVPSTAVKVVVMNLVYSAGWLQTDDFSLSTQSTTPPPSAPTVNITSPAASSTASGNIILSATASDASGVAGVQFKIDGTNIGAEDTTAPFEVNWNSASISNGSHTVTATARNTSNLATTSSPVQFTVSNVSIPPPATSNLIPNPSVETIDPANSAKPQSWTTAKTGTNTTAFNYLTTGHSGGRSLRVQMTQRTSGNAKWYFTPINVTPGATYTYTDWYQGNISSHIQASFTNTTGTIINIESPNIAQSTTWKQASFSFVAPANAKTLVVYHYINLLGQLATDDFDIEAAAAPTAPTVNITSPVNNATVSGTQLVTASASDNKAIASVQLKLDGINLGPVLTASPYTYSWDTTSASNGSHNLTAVATNSSGLTTTSGTVTVNVQNSTTPPSTGSNLISNPSFEASDGTNPTGWSADRWGTNTAQFVYANTGRTGSRSATINMTQFTSGDAKWDATPVNITAGKTYIYNDYYTSNVQTRVIAAFIDGNGNYSYQELAAAATAPGWTQYAAEFTAPSNASKLVIFHLIDKIGSLTIDDVSLIEYTPPVPVPGSYIANPSVETADPANSQLPAGWNHSSWGNNTTTFQYMNEGHTGNRSVKATISNYNDGDAKWYFNPIKSLVPGSQYRFTTWYKTNTIPHAVAVFLDTQGNEHYFGMPNPQPNGSTTQWQLYTNTFDVPSYAVSATVFFLVPGNGWVQVDDQSLSPYSPVGWNRPLVSLTFDDGYEENVSTVLPTLDKYGFKSTQCYETQDIEGVPGASNMVLSFYNDGHEICAHTVTHPFLTTLTTAQVDYELSHSQQVLQGITGTPVRDFASPYGDYNQSVDTEIAKYFRSHRTVDEGYNSKDNFDIYRLRVQNMTPNTTLQEFQYWLDKAKATNTWLIIVYHRVTTGTPEAFDSTKAQFDSQMQALSASGLTVKTWSSALDELTSQL
jgi:peptidoglycan/xylan/chitin deacetylase (PgdA/CDA1 family)